MEVSSADRLAMLWRGETCNFRASIKSRGHTENTDPKLRWHVFTIETRSVDLGKIYDCCRRIYIARVDG